MPRLPDLVSTAALLALASLAAEAGYAAGMPLPWLLGPLAATALAATAGAHHLPEGYEFPQALRLAFIAVIG